MMELQRITLTDVPGAETVIVGFGRCGRDLHLGALREMAAHLRPRRVIAVDPRPIRDSGPVVVHPSMEPAWQSLADPRRAIFHVATPPQLHQPVVVDLVNRGARRIIVEKPIAPTAAAAALLLRHAAAGGATVIPVAVWPHSTLVREVRRHLIGLAVKSMHITQSKMRIERTVTDRGHLSALHVEVPHQVMLAIALAGSVASVQSVRTWDARIDGRIYPDLGGAQLELLHTGGVRTEIFSDLCAPGRQRRLRVVGDGVEVNVDLPLSADSHSGRIQVSGYTRAADRYDRPLTSFMNHAYELFKGGAEVPAVELGLHMQVLRVLEEAAVRAGEAALDKEREL
ncbi:MAG: Gfo/Idh/MocA family oxidoreductase [Hamadaea sp.]|nr:Gfo/Idh/MocA family oxidoreductase [Hamadaea sp.]